MADKSTFSPADTYPVLAPYREEVQRCFKCGLCRSVCPSFTDLGAEYASPRGRVQFARAVLEGELPLDRRLQSHILNCLNCMRCAEACPASVRTDRIVLALRAEYARRGKLNPIKKLAFNTVLRSARLLGLSAWAGKLAQRWFMEQEGILDTYLPALAGYEDKQLPRLADRPAFDRLPENSPALYGQPKMRVAYFIGCATNLIYPEIAEATVRILTRNNIEVIIPRGQVCCGIPVYSSGDFKSARALAEKNREVFRGLNIDAVITDCSSCSAALKHDIRDLLDIDVTEVPVYDLTEFLAEVIDIERTFAETPLRITWHDPCHLARGQHITSAPRDLLRMIPGIEYVEMEGADECCGGAGTFAYTHHDLARKTGARKAAHIRETGADLVATTCPSCTMQLADLLAHEGIDIGIVHPVILLDRAMSRQETADSQFEFVDTE